ncbi:MAG: glutathione S-transferase [Gammaproteobacteria bacterium]|nr:glutathione S-transferase [Gammaproteobacteria bacterium]
MTKLPVLYSFRRCPYAIRARLAIKVSRQPVELREVSLADKPAEMQAISVKATVPVLQLPDSTVIDESRDIMLWALSKNDPENWLSADNGLSNQLIDMNDTDFKQHLDHYKYADRFPEQPVEKYRQAAEVFLQQLELRLCQHRYLTADTVSMADMAIFPFIRQCAFVDKLWFDQTPYINLQRWLAAMLASDLFNDVMKKYPLWKTDEDITRF